MTLFGMCAFAVYSRQLDEDWLADLFAEGFEAYLEDITTPSGSTLVSVRFGDYSDSHAAWTAALEWAAGGPGREAIVLLGSGP